MLICMKRENRVKVKNKNKKILIGFISFYQKNYALKTKTKSDLSDCKKDKKCTSNDSSID